MYCRICRFTLFCNCGGHRERTLVTLSASLSISACDLVLETAVLCWEQGPQAAAHLTTSTKEFWKIWSDQALRHCLSLPFPITIQEPLFRTFLPGPATGLLGPAQNFVEQPVAPLFSSPQPWGIISWPFSAVPKGLSKAFGTHLAVSKLVTCGMCWAQTASPSPRGLKVSTLNLEAAWVGVSMGMGVTCLPSNSHELRGRLPVE